MPTLLLHPMLAPLLQGGAVPARWIAEMRGAGEWADRFVGDGWDSTEPLRALPFAGLLELPLGGDASAFAAALAKFDAATDDSPESEAQERRARSFAGPTQRAADQRNDSRQAVDRVDRIHQGGREPPLSPASPSGPISPAFAAAHLARRASAAGLDSALRQLVGPQPVGRRDTSSAREPRPQASAWNQVVGGAGPQAERASRSPAAGAAGLPSPPNFDSGAQRAVSRGAAARLADAADRVLRTARRSPSVRGRSPTDSDDSVDGSWPAAATRARTPAANDAERLARGNASTLGARAAVQGMSGLRGLAARAAAASFDDTIEAPRLAAAGAAVEAATSPPRDDARSVAERPSTPGSLDDEQLAMQLARVLRREAERDGVDVDDVSP